MTIDINAVAETIGIPVRTWAGNCHGISEAIVRADALRPWGGPKTIYRLTRGHYVGPIAAGSYFDQRRGMPFIAHSWIQAYDLTVAVPPNPLPPIHVMIDPVEASLHNSVIVQNPVIDPTRFAFDGKNPYIFCGESDHYDPGGNLWRASNLPMLPPFDTSRLPIRLTLPVETEVFIAQLLDGQEYGDQYPYRAYTFGLIMWLANLPLPMLEGHAEPIYRAIVQAGQEAALPLDNRSIVLGDVS